MATATATAAAASKTAAQHEAQVKAAVQQLNDFMQHFATTLNFTIDTDTKQIVVKVMNPQTGEVIRQIPSAVALELAKAADSLKGLIISEKV
jgi:flagellar protein FlaG